MLEITNLSKSIKGKEIVKDVSFQVKKGSVFGLIGPNGAGKTTILRMITGLVKPTNGQVTINGKDIQKDFNAAIARVGVCTEIPGFYSEFTAVQNLNLTATILGISPLRVMEVLAKVGLDEHKHVKMHKYSLGMKQRLGIANAILTNPQLLILDEPTNGLDVQGIVEIRSLIKNLQEQGFTVLLCSHLLTEVEKICDEIAILREGQIAVPNALEAIANHNKRLEYVIRTAPHVSNSALLEAHSAVSKVSVGVDSTNIVLNEDSIHDVILHLISNDYKILEVEKIKYDLESIFMSYVGGVKHE